MYPKTESQMWKKKKGEKFHLAHAFLTFMDNSLCWLVNEKYRPSLQKKKKKACVCVYTFFHTDSGLISILKTSLRTLNASMLSCECRNTLDRKHSDDHPMLAWILPVTASSQLHKAAHFSVGWLYQRERLSLYWTICTSLWFPHLGLSSDLCSKRK